MVLVVLAIRMFHDCAHSSVPADVPPLHMLAVHKTTKFEFIFTPLTRAKSHELLQTVDVLMREFNASTKYREVRMRGVLMNKAWVAPPSID